MEQMPLTHQLNFNDALGRVRKVARKTPLILHKNLSKKYRCQVYLKREDLQVVRSYKIRGAYNMLSSLPANVLAHGAVCASAGNHAQGFAYSCRQLQLQGVVFMPNNTPRQKIQQTKMFGEECISIVLTGDTYDDCAEAAKIFALEKNMAFIPPFDDLRIIEGQATVGMEVLDDVKAVDYIFLPVGGGGLSAGVGLYLKEKLPAIKVIGAEPEGAPSMKAALTKGHPVTLPQIEKFVDGAAVKRVGDVTFKFCQQILDDIVLVPEGKICTTILQLYNEDAIVVEPAGALSITALDYYADKIVGKQVVCVVSGSNNDIDRLQEIKERSLQYEGLKHYFLIRFAQRPGALKEFVNDVLGPNDDITRFEYVQKHNKEFGPAIVGIELKNRHDYQQLITRLNNLNWKYTELNKNDMLFDHLVS